MNCNKILKAANEYLAAFVIQDYQTVLILHASQ